MSYKCIVHFNNPYKTEITRELVLDWIPKEGDRLSIVNDGDLQNDTWVVTGNNKYKLLKEGGIVAIEIWTDSVRGMNYYLSEGG